MLPVRHWQQWLAEAQGLPSDSALWDELDLFVKELNSIRDRKLLEAKEHLIQCEHALNQVQNAHGPLLRYLGLGALYQEGVQTIPKDKTRELLNQIEQLSAQLGEVENLRLQQLASFSEEERRTEQIRALRKQIQEAHQDISLALEQSEPVPPILPNTESADAGPRASPDAETQQPATMASVSSDPPTLSKLAPESTIPAPTPSETITVASIIPDLIIAPELPGTPARPESKSVDPEPSSVSADAREQPDVPVQPEPVSSTQPSLSLAGSTSPQGGPPLSELNELRELRELRELHELRDLRPSPMRVGDEDLRSMISEVLAHGQQTAVLPTLLVDQQRRWLRQGQNLRGYLAARYLEDHRLSIEPPPVPAWLCWLALLVSDAGATRIDFQAQEFSSDLYQFCSTPQPSGMQRFLVCWLCASLLGPQPRRAMQLAVHLRSSLWEAEWAHDDFFFFCRRYLLDPAREGKEPRVRAEDAPELLQQRFRERIATASNIMSLSNNYRNSLVRRYWLQLVGRGGPVHSLLEHATRGALPDAIPSPEEVAIKVSDWPIIEADYRRNIERRLGNFVDILREALVLQKQLQAQNSAAQHQTPLPTAEAEHALACASPLLTQIEEEGCASLAAFQKLVERLRVCREERG